MACYEYECEACGHKTERFLKMSDPDVDKQVCHELVILPASTATHVPCAGRLKRVIGSVQQTRIDGRWHFSGVGANGERVQSASGRRFKGLGP
jgi:predicted nucleic acid-binding Zn ribbon protein